MNTLYNIFAIILIFFGLWLIVRKIKIFMRQEQGNLGYDAGGLIFGVVCIITGVLMISY